MRWWLVPVVGCLLVSCGDGAEVRPPPRDVAFDYQLGGAYPPADDVGIVVRDRGDEPDAQRYSVCYVNAFQTQPGADVDADLLLRDAGGRPVEDPDWPGEYLLDVSTDDRRAAVLDLVGPWIDGCARSGYDAVEPDNLDSWTRSGGLLDPADAASTARLLVERAHAAGLAVAQKNAAELLADDLGFDFAVAEECHEFDECAAFADRYDVVLAVEYDEDGLREACAGQLDGVSTQFRDRDVSPPGSPGHVTRWCTR